MAQAAFRLVVRTGPNPGVVFDLTKDVTLVGRDVINDVTIGDAEVSRQHCRLTRTPGGYVLEDLGSTNGTFLNGERLVAPRVLSAGDLVGLGENVALTFDTTSPEAAATMMRPAAGRVAGPPPPAPRVSYPPPTTYEPAVPGVMPEEPAPAGAAAPDRKRWILAGCGCLVLLAICLGLFWFMDAYYPDILYAPLRLLGF